MVAGHLRQKDGYWHLVLSFIDENGNKKTPSKRRAYAETVFPATQRPGAQAPKTARQERKETSVETRSIHREQPSAVRNGMAGSAAEMKSTAQVSAEKQRVPGPAVRSNSAPTAPERSGGKKAMSAAIDMNQRFAGQTERKTKRKTRRSGGKKNG